ncbi:unnamed protein product [Soboliphyme baturini]|uniref:Protein quiver n=1 Tax=Soboliphyme baturini TaxID=241478 RepID=A0A183IT21_9BILA|nr:unnamed protein product [Soboliphyme baturini]
MLVCHLCAYVLLTMDSVYSLRCKMCSGNDDFGNSITTDNFQIVTNLDQPYCEDMKEVECFSYQNACLKVVIHMPRNAKFWLGLGCTEAKHIRMGCYRLQTKTYEMDISKETRFYGKLNPGVALQDICLCNTDYCNSGKPAMPYRHLIKLSLLCSVIIYAMNHL